MSSDNRFVGESGDFSFVGGHGTEAERVLFQEARVELREVSPERFSGLVAGIIDEHPDMGKYLTYHPPNELRDHKLFATADGTVGCAVAPDGDMQNLFNVGGPAGAGSYALRKAIEAGGCFLDCYDGFLPNLYANYGFRETGRMKFDPEYAPEAWNLDEDGYPDVVFMAYQPEELIVARANNYYEPDEWEQAKADSRRTADCRRGSEAERQGVGRASRGAHSQPSAEGRSAPPEDGRVAPGESLSADDEREAIGRVKKAISPFAVRGARVNMVGYDEVAADFKLPIAKDAPFSSSFTYSPDRDVVTGGALRFSPDLLWQYDEAVLRDKMDELVTESDPPSGGLWTTYIRGDARETGPHIMTPGGFSNVDLDEFSAWVGRVLEWYPKVFDGSDTLNQEAQTLSLGAEQQVESEIADEIKRRTGQLVVDVFDDESIRFLPAIDKVSAEYMEPEDPGFNEDHERCETCVHYISGGGCHLVRGSIDPDAYCAQLYADFSVSAHEHEGDEGVELNLDAFGSEFDWDERDVKEFEVDVRERIEAEIRRRAESRRS